MLTKSEIGQPQAHAEREYKAGIRSMWALGDYQAFASELVWELGAVVVEAAEIQPGQRVLDVAAGTGNAALRAAQAGASVIASDLTPEHFAAGRDNACRLGVDVEWREADAEALPFAEAEFDVVTSVLGAIFAPRQQRVADEMLRVCKKGGKIVMANFTPEGLASDFFGVFAPYMPPPRPGDQPPVLWGSEAHVRELFGERVALRMTRHSYVERAETPRAYCDFFKRTFGPAVATYASLEDQPEQRAELDRAFLEFAEQNNSGRPGGPAAYQFEYLLVVGEKH